MSVRLVMKNSLPASASPFRLRDDHGREIAWANQFLDAQQVRQLSLRSLRAYAYDLLHLARWFQTTRHSLARLTQSLLLDYVRHQLDQQPSPTPQTINHRLCVLRCLYRFHYAQEIPGKPLFPRRYTTRSSLGYGRRQTKITTNLRLRQPRRVIVPLSADQVARFLGVEGKLCFGRVSSSRRCGNCGPKVQGAVGKPFFGFSTAPAVSTTLSPPEFSFTLLANLADR